MNERAFCSSGILAGFVNVPPGDQTLTVHEVADLTGITVRTLHYYDQIGLLRPAKVTDANYRLYDREALRRLQSILLFRELQFPLKEIKAMLDSPAFDAREALAQQIRLLELQYKHTGELIAFARKLQKKGVNDMDFQVFDKKEIEQYKEEVKARWGETEAYREFTQKGNSDSIETTNQLMALFAEAGTLRNLPPSDAKVQETVHMLQSFITKHYYHCTDEILSELGELYVCDERFRKNIDRAGGEGTAEFVRNAIKVYCAGKLNRRE